MSKKTKKTKNVKQARNKATHGEFHAVHPDKWEWFAGIYGAQKAPASREYSGVLRIEFRPTTGGMLARYVRYNFVRLGEYFAGLKVLDWKMAEHPRKSGSNPKTTATVASMESLADLDARFNDFDTLLRANRICGNLTEHHEVVTTDPSPGAMFAGREIGTLTEIHDEGEFCGSQDFTCAKCRNKMEHDPLAGAVFCLPGIEYLADTKVTQALLKFWGAWARAHAAGLERRGDNLKRKISQDALGELHNCYRKHLSAAQVCYTSGRKHGLDRHGLDLPGANADIIEHYKDSDAFYKAQFVNGAPHPATVTHSPVVSEAMAAILPGNRGRGARQAPKEYAKDKAWEKCKSDRDRYPVNSKETLAKHFRRLK